MRKSNEVYKLNHEAIFYQQNCPFCKESSLQLGEKTKYGSVIIYKIGDSAKNGWFATLSPKTGGDPKQDFTIQLMPQGHLTHFSQMKNYPALARNYGTAFSKISEAVARIIGEEDNLKATASSKEEAISIAIYGKCTTWKDKKEHLHIKIFPFRGLLGQPCTVDSSFERKKIYTDLKSKKKFIRMKPIKKIRLSQARLEKLARILISLLA